MSYQLGVDLGTTYTAAAVANGMPPTMVGLGNRALQIPSVVFLDEDDTVLVGEAAERKGLTQPSRVVREFKRRIGDTVPILVAGSPFSPQALTARLLQHVVATATRQLGEPPAKVVLTHPANWGPYKLDLLDQAARLAGIEHAARCPEPLAAAAQYAAQSRMAVGDTIAVYDLGGGTFDACVLQKTPTGFTLLGTPEGIEHLGGIDFDDALFQHVLGLLGDRLSIDPDDPDAVIGLARLRRDCVDAKEALSTDTDTVLPVTLPGLSSTLRLNRTEFESIIRPALADTISALDRAVRSADHRPDQLRAIVLVGGSSRIPLIGELLHHNFATTPTALDTHPKHDVALGAVQTDHTRRDMEVVADTAPHPAPRPDQPPGDGSITPTTPITIGSKAGAPTTPPTPIPSSASVPPPPAPARWRLIVLSAGAAVIAAISISIAVIAGLPDRNGPLEQTTIPVNTAAPSSSTPSPSGTRPSPLPGNLPTSTPLPITQLVVPMRSDGGDWNLYLADTTKPGPIKQLTTADTSENLPVLSPRRDTIIYVEGAGDSATRRTLRVMAADGTGDRPLFDLPTDCERAIRPAWDPTDPSRLAVPCVSPAGKYSMRFFRTDGTLLGTVRAPKGKPRMDDPSFSPDGKLLGFWAAPNSSWDGGTLYTVPVSGGTPKQLLPDPKEPTPGQDADIAFSPDGKYVAFRRRIPTDQPQGQLDIFRADVNGSNIKQLTNGAANEQDPTWSPNADQIAIKSDADSTDWLGRRNTRVWIIASDGGQRQQVLWTAPETDRAQAIPSWSSR